MTDRQAKLVTLKMRIMCIFRSINRERAVIELAKQGWIVKSTKGTTYGPDLIHVTLEREGFMTTRIIVAIRDYWSAYD